MVERVSFDRFEREHVIDRRRMRRTSLLSLNILLAFVFIGAQIAHGGSGSNQRDGDSYNSSLGDVQASIRYASGVCISCSVMGGFGEVQYEEPLPISHWVYHLEVGVYFTDIAPFTDGPDIFAWDYNTGSWDLLGVMGQGTDVFRSWVLDTLSHISGTNQVRIRIYAEPNDSSDINYIRFDWQYDDQWPVNPNSYTSDPPVDAWTTDNTINVSWSGAFDDRSGVQGYSIEWTTSHFAIPDDIMDTTISDTTSTALSDNDTWYIHIRTVDNANNWNPGAYNIGPFKVDVTAPSAPSPDDGVAGWSNDDTPIFNWSEPADLSGIQGYSYSIDGLPDDTVDTANLNVTLPSQADGNHTFYVKAQDNAGNWGVEGQHEFQIDATAPAEPPGLTCPALIATQTPTISWSEPSDMSGIAGYSYSVDFPPSDTIDTTSTMVVLTPQSEDSHVFYVKAIDNAGNWGPAANCPFVVDITPPETPSPDDGVDDWTSVSTPTFTWSPVFDLNGIAGYSFDIDIAPDDNVDTTLTSVTLVSQADGIHTFYVRAIDNAGIPSVEGYHEFKIDSVVPETPNPDDGVTGWTNDNTPTFSWNEPTDLSGVVGYSYSIDSSPDSIIDLTGTIVLLSPQSDGIHTFYVKAVDAAGNWGSEGSHEFRIDATGPEAPLPDDGIANWTNVNTPTFSWSEPWDTSGISGYSYAVDAFPDNVVDTTSMSEVLGAQTDGLHVFYVKALDDVGNWGAVGSHEFKIDTIAPGAPSPDDSVADWTNVDTPIFTWVELADLSGMAGYSYSVDSIPDETVDTTSLTLMLNAQPDGVHIFYVRAVDAAGNWGSEGSHEFRIDTMSPMSEVEDLSSVQITSTFLVNWSGNDSAGASGIRWFDVQYREGTSGQWTDWIIQTTDTSASFTGTNGETYYFRSRALDKAGNQESYPTNDGDTNTTISFVVTLDIGGIVYDSGTGDVLVTATVSVMDGDTLIASADTDSEGRYALTVSPGNYMIVVAKDGYHGKSSSITVAQTTEIDFYLAPEDGLGSQADVGAYLWIIAILIIIVIILIILFLRKRPPAHEDLSAEELWKDVY